VTKHPLDLLVYATFCWVGLSLSYQQPVGNPLQPPQEADAARAIIPTTSRQPSTTPSGGRRRTCCLEVPGQVAARLESPSCGARSSHDRMAQVSFPRAVSGYQPNSGGTGQHARRLRALSSLEMIARPR